MTSGWLPHVHVQRFLPTRKLGNTSAARVAASESRGRAPAIVERCELPSAKSWRKWMDYWIHTLHQTPSCVCVSGDVGLRPDRLQQSPLSETRLLTAPPCRSAKKHFAERPVGIHKLYPIGQRKSYSVFHCLFGVFSAHHSRIWSVLRTSSNCNSRTRSQRSLPRSHLKRRFINCYLSGSQYLQGFASI